MGFVWLVNVLDIFDGDEGRDVIEINRITIKLHFFYSRLHCISLVLSILGLPHLIAYLLFDTIDSVEEALLL